MVGGSVFQPELVSFQFVMSGAIAGVFVGAGILLPWRRTVRIALMIYVLVLLVNKTEVSNARASYAVYVGVLYLGTMGGLWSDRWSSRLRYGKFVIWSAWFGVLHLASVYLLGWILSQPPEPGIVLVSAQLGASIGAAVGLGNELATGVETSMAKKKAPPGALDT
jgi:hypothetical protein